MREQIVLTSGWRFQPDWDSIGEESAFWPSHYWRADYDASHWREVTVPCSLERGHPDLEWFVGAGWYRCAFHAPASWHSKRVLFRCEGANYHTRVWVNDALVGHSEDGFLPFQFPIHDQLRYGQENVLVVRADNESRVEEVPGPQVGWRPYGGILREVSLEVTEPCYIASVAYVAEPAGEAAGKVALRGAIRNERAQEARVSLSLRLVGPEGTTIADLGSPPVPVPAGQVVEVELTGPLERITAWSPDHPALYKAEATLHENTGVLDVAETRLGFRRIETRGSQILLNGQPIYLKGFNRHEDSPTSGGCTDLDMARRDLAAMKDLGCNWVRLCHYPHHPGELDLCDELGLLAMGEIPVYGSVGMREDEALYRKKMEHAQRQLRAMVERDRNHPSLVVWSVSNETHEQHPVVREGNGALIALARALDPTRLATHVSDHWDRRRGTPGQFAHDDLICLNAYPWWSRLEFLRKERLGEAAQYWTDNLDWLHDSYPDKPILIAEFGGRSLAGVYDNPMGEDSHAGVLEAQFAAMAAPYICGATIWCYADHAWPFWLEYSGRAVSISPFGVVTRQREPKALVCEAVRRMFGGKA